MYALFRLGYYEFLAGRGKHIKRQIEGIGLGWCLSASVAVADGELTCTISFAFVVDSLASYAWYACQLIDMTYMS